MTGKRELTWKLTWQGQSDWIHRDALDSDTLDSHVEGRISSADQSLSGVLLGVQGGSRFAESSAFLARDLWPVIPAPDGRSATLAVRRGDDTFRGCEREKTAKARPTRATGAKEVKVERAAKVARKAKRVRVMARAP